MNFAVHKTLIFILIGDYSDLKNRVKNKMYL